MFNLLISYDDNSWNLNPYEFARSRVAVEYTVDEISERYKFLDKEAIDELKSFPTLFVTEGESTNSRIGYINNIKVRQNSVVIEYDFDGLLPVLPIGTIEKLKSIFDIGGFELHRTHWAIKDEDLFDVLIRYGYITQEQVNSSLRIRENSIYKDIIPITNKELNLKQVFIVHGHDEIAKLDAEKYITKLGLEPIILHRQASSGKTIIEKIEAYSNVGFAVILYTHCDNGTQKSSLNFLPRARQNVVFEHGYLIGKLGRSRVAALVKGNVELPNDISGIIYITMDDQGQWQGELKKEMKNICYISD
ncbi:TIR domain-containing protein [Candidatus Margulisiibacteriota bacterium]